VRIVGVVRSDIKSLKDVSCSGPHSHAVFVLKSFCSGAEISATCGENFPSWFTTPINLQSSVTLVGGAICFRASSFCGSADMPLSLMKGNGASCKFTLTRVQSESSRADLRQDLSQS